MALRDELPPKRHNGSICTIKVLLDSLNPKTRAELVELIADVAVGTVQLSELAKAKKWDVSYASIKRHRSGQCLCR